MSEEEFRKIALSMAGAIEASHMGHPDFRVGGKIFATLRAPGPGFGVVMLTLIQQKELVDELPRAFQPVKGGWGARGATQVHLKAATKADARRAIETAFRNKT